MTQKYSLLFELGVEELPAQALPHLSEVLKSTMQLCLHDAQLNFGELSLFATPRRLAVLVKMLDGQQKDETLVVRGPSIKAAFDQDGQPLGPAKGFAASCGVAVSELTTITAKKGEYLAFDQFKKGQTSQELMPDIILACIKKLSAAKGMRWGANTYKFLRPVRWLTVLLDTQVIACEVYGLQSGRVTFGHRIHHPEPIELTHAEEYELRLQNKGYVVPRFETRRQMILDQIRSTAASRTLSVSPSSALMDEITGLVEWPVTLCGSFDEAFLQVPHECLISTMEVNQKYIAMYEPDGSLAHTFLFVANLESSQPQQVIQGNERVIRPRFADAQFFFETDLKRPLKTLIPELERVIYHKKLGSMFDKTERLATIAGDIATILKANVKNAIQAGQLSKVDLLTLMVGEFPELQGTMGCYYAKAQGFPLDIAQALQEQYLPRGQGDGLPNSPLGVVLSLADKFDALIGLFAVGQEPKADKDPFALRRMALGIVRMCIELELNINLETLGEIARQSYQNINMPSDTVEKVSIFIMHRLPTLYRESGIDMRLVRAVEALRIFNPLDFNKRLMVLQQFYEGDDAQALAEVHKRVNNILKKNSTLMQQSDFTATVVVDALVEPAEKALHQALCDLEQDIQHAIQQQEYQRLLELGVSLRQAVDLFFVEVKVMSDVAVEKNNRMNLLIKLRALFAQVGDLSFLA